MNPKQKNSNMNSLSPQSKQNSAVVNSRTYYFTNCIFQGLTKSMKKIGTGIILFDDGMCGIVSYNSNE